MGGKVAHGVLLEIEARHKAPEVGRCLEDGQQLLLQLNTVLRDLRQTTRSGAACVYFATR